MIDARWRAFGAAAELDSVMAGAGKSRLSVGFYDNGEHFCSTVARLVDLGLDAGQLGIVTRSEALPALLAPRVDAARRALIMRILDEVEPLSAPGLELVASRGPIRSLLDFGHAVPVGPRKEGGRPAFMVGSDLGAQLRGGATALAVTSATAEQQWASARILLERSILPVLTHEFRIVDRER